jgi:hypothetical protein
MPEPVFDPDQERVLIDEEPPEGEPRTLSERLARAAPWWMISILSHSIAAVVCVFIVAVAQGVQDVEYVLVNPRDIPDQVVRPKPKNIETPKELDLTKEVTDPVLFKAKEADHTETPNDEEFEKAKGESLDALTDKPFRGLSTSDIVGSGGGAAGAYGGRFGGKDHLVNKGGGSKLTQDAVINALRWLARHQNDGGSWSATRHVDRCGRVPKFSGTCIPNPGAESFDIGLTGLSLLAFLGAGYTHLSKETHDGICFGTVVRRGVEYLMKSQDATGRITPDDIPKYMYNHLLAAFALSEAYGMTGSAMIKDGAQRAIDFTIQAQNPGKAWRYSARSGDNDSSVSGWGAQALKSAEVAELSFSKEAYQGILAWYDEVTAKDYAWTGYTDARVGIVVIPGVSEHFSNHPALSAISAMTRIFLRKGKGDPRVRGGLELAMADLPEWDARGLKVDFYYWYYASYAIFLFDGPSGSFWKRWNEKIKAAVLDKQCRTAGDCRHGSWEPVDRWSSEGGRVYTTATGALILEVYYRYAAAVNPYGSNH